MTDRAIAAYVLMAFAVFIAVILADRLLDARRRKRHRNRW